MTKSPSHLDLSFSNKPLSELEARIGELNTLESLDLTSSGLQSLPPWLSKAQGLRRLSIGMNPDLDQDSLKVLSELPQLRVLDLQRCQLTQFPSGLEDHPELQQIDLSHNQISRWPFTHKAPPKLTALRIFGQVLDLSEGSAPLPQLQELSLGSSPRQLSQLPPALLQAMPELRSLRIWGALEELPSSLCNLSKLEDLDLRGNRLHDSLWPLLFKLSQLKTLRLQENQLQSVPHGFGQLVHLEHLELEKNSIQSLGDDFWSPLNLQVVNLSDNELQELPAPSQELPALRELWLARNQITALPDALEYFPALRHMDLEDNQLRTLPPSILKMPKLSDPILTGNLFKEEARERVQELEDLIYKRNPFARMHWPRFEGASKAAPRSAITEALSKDVIKAAEKLGATYQQRSHPQESWATAAGEWPLTVAFQSWLRDLSWPEHSYFDLKSDEQDIWSVDFSKPRPIADFECSFLHPYICLADYHGGNELLVIRLDDDSPGDPMLYHLDHEDGSLPDAEALHLRLSTFLSKLERN